MLGFNFNLVSNSISGQKRKEIGKSKERLKPLLEKLSKSKAVVMEEVQKNIRIMALMAWGVGLIFKEKELSEMLEYMQNPDLKELEKMFDVISSGTYEALFEDYFLDNLSIVRDYNRSFSIFNDTELQEAAQEAMETIFYYLCSMKYELEGNLNHKKNVDFKDFARIWIYPCGVKPKSQNFFFSEPLASTREYDDDDKRELGKETGYYFVLGDPGKEDSGLVKAGDGLKIQVLLHLFDCLFNLEISSEERLDLVLPFGLSNSNSEKVFKALDAMVTDYNTLRESLSGRLLDNRQKLKNVINSVKATCEELDDKYKRTKDKYERSLEISDNLLKKSEELKIEVDLSKFLYEELKTIIGAPEGDLKPESFD